MTDRWITARDPREGECGVCPRVELAATDVLGAALVAMLDKIEGVKR